MDGNITPDLESLNLNPEDIESIEVFKDESGSINGISAVNGIVLVATKEYARTKEAQRNAANIERRSQEMANVKEKTNSLQKEPSDLAANAPVYVIDGLIIPESQDQPLAGLAPEDIESIEVLKDASPSVYGANASNGVVLVTTKTYAQVKRNNSQQGEIPLIRIENMPKFQGSGDLNFFRMWVIQNIKYPAEAASNRIQGQVTASFVIERDGSLGDIKILQSPHQSLSDEITRILKESPKWTPGNQEGGSVMVSFTLPIDFTLSQN